MCKLGSGYVYAVDVDTRIRIKGKRPGKVNRPDTGYIVSMTGRPRGLYNRVVNVGFLSIFFTFLFPLSPFCSMDKHSKKQ